MRAWIILALLLVTAACTTTDLADDPTDDDPFPDEDPGKDLPPLPPPPPPPGIPGGGLLELTDCTEPRPELCTMQYDPVCGVYSSGIQCITAPCATTSVRTMGNDCSACGDAEIIGYYDGACEDIRFVVCEETQTGFSAEQFAEDIGGVCVDVCPYNMDGYTTQTGIQVCITRYDEAAIDQWTTCTESSESCECVKAYETTGGEQISDAEYRCVPEHYSERLLFRGGVDRLDENGEQSVMIA